MPLPLGAVVISALGAVVAKAFEFFYQFFAYKMAKSLAVGTAAVIAAAALTLTMSQTIKGLIAAVRMAMPQSLGLATFFLPSNINQILAVMITIKAAHFIWQWSMKNLARYTTTVY